MPPFPERSVSYSLVKWNMFRYRKCGRTNSLEIWVKLGKTLDKVAALGSSWFASQLLCDLSIAWVLPRPERCTGLLSVKLGVSVSKVANCVKCAGNSWTDLFREIGGRYECFALMILSLAIQSKSTVLILLFCDTLRGAIIPFGRYKFKVNPSALSKNVSS